MQSTLLAKMKQALLEKKAKIEAELKSFAHRQSKKQHLDDFQTDFPDYGTKEDENASEVQTFTDNLALESTLEGTLEDVNRALERIDTGTYGKCKYCGKLIDERRLAARPESGSCVNCKKERLGRSS